MDHYRDKFAALSLAERDQLRKKLSAWERKDSAVPGTKVLVAFYAAAAELSPEALLSYLRENLPGHLVPGEVVKVPSLPKTPNGKIDRVTLQRYHRPPTADQPRKTDLSLTNAETRMAEIWSRVLNVQSVGLHDDFFALGGHSLLATQVIMEIESIFGTTVPLNALFKHPTVHQLCKCVAERGSKPAASMALRKTARADRAPLSQAQRRLWYASQVTGTGIEYKIVKIIEITGGLNVPALSRSLRQIATRHESLRTTFGYADGKLVQKINPPEAIALRFVDVSALPAQSAEAASEAVRRGVLTRPFELERGPLLRVTLLKLGSASYRLLFDVHHIVIDGWSFGILVNELNEIYAAHCEGRAARLEPLPLQYRDYVLWENERLTKAVLDEQLAYWRARLEGAPPLNFGPDRKAAEEADGEIDFDLGADLSTRIMDVCRRTQSTPFIFLTGAYYMLLHYHTGALDISVGADVANRETRDFSKLIGFFVNQIVLRVGLADDLSFEQLCQRTRQSVEEAFAHKDVPYDAVVRELRSKSSERDRDSLFRAKFVFHHELPHVRLPGIESHFMAVRPHMRKFDLLLSVEEGKHGLKGKIEYSGHWFDQRSARRLIDHYRILCETATEGTARTIAELRQRLRQHEADDERRAVSEVKAARRAGLRAFLETINS